MSTKKFLFRVRYLQLGRYKTTLTGYIDSWSDMGIVLIDQDKRRYTLQPANVIRIEPLYLPKKQILHAKTNEQHLQMDIFDQILLRESE